MNLTELEAASGRLLEEQKRLRTIDAELAALRQEIKEAPRRAEKDKSFFALIGMNWTEPGHVSQEADLKKERDAVMATINEVQDTVLTGFGSEGLVVPLDPTPVVDRGRYTFRFRSGATFPKTVQELSEMLGIPVPLKIGSVTIFPEMVMVTEADEYFAKVRIVEAFDSIRKTVSLKLSSKQQTQ
jgi:hypothetical protein